MLLSSNNIFVIAEVHPHAVMAEWSDGTSQVFSECCEQNTIDADLMRTTDQDKNWLYHGRFYRFDYHLE